MQVSKQSMLRRLGIGRFLAARRVRAEFQALATAAPRSSALDPVRRSLDRAIGRPSAADRELWEQIEGVRATLIVRTDVIEEVDYGAGSPGQQYSEDEQRKGVVTTTAVSTLAGFSKAAPWAQLLFHLTCARRPARALEMGTCVGISGSYIAGAMRQIGDGHLWTIEGSPATARLAQQTFSTLNLEKHVTSVVGPFHQTLGPCLTEYGPFDLVFIDGHHDGKATIDYFKLIRAHLSPHAILIFDDIAWSEEMANAWHDISTDAAVQGQMRLGGMGAIVL